MTTELLTIGHSNHPLAVFLDLLAAHRIEAVIDVRRLPGSKRYPQFNADALQASLADRQIGYQRLEGLTGRRPVSKVVPFGVNAWWLNRGFHNYADHALALSFRTDLATLLALAATRRVVIMCSEAVWWRCHRRIISDYALAEGAYVGHILGPGQVRAAELSAGAVLMPNGTITYPPTPDPTPES